MQDKKALKEAYDDFAGIYHRHWSGSSYYRQAAPVVDCLLFSRLPRRCAVLDLCCGTGRMAADAAARGFTVTGVDISREMLRYAREAMPASVFVQCDARRFYMPAAFKGVFSTFESMSHILCAGDLLAVFSNVCASLDQGGIFVFDLLTERSYRELWKGSTVIYEGGRECIISGSYDASAKTGRADIMVPGADGGQPLVTCISEACHDLDEIANSLARAGFIEIEFFSAEEDLGMTGDLGVGRIFVRALKPVLLEAMAETNTTGGGQAA